MGGCVRLREIAELVRAEVMAGGEGLDERVESCFAADLMSDVLAFAGPDALLLTALATVQAVHAADVADCAGILLVAGKRPSPDALHLGLARRLVMMSTPLTMFEACGILFAQGLAPSRKR